MLHHIFFQKIRHSPFFYPRPTSWASGGILWPPGCCCLHPNRLITHHGKSRIETERRETQPFNYCVQYCIEEDKDNFYIIWKKITSLKHLGNSTYIHVYVQPNLWKNTYVVWFCKKRGTKITVQTKIYWHTNYRSCHLNSISKGSETLVGDR